MQVQLSESPVTNDIKCGCLAARDGKRAVPQGLAAAKKNDDGMELI
jgi:hypothetical protein